MKQSKIVLTTTDTIPGKEYEIIGLVMGNRLTWLTSKGAAGTAISRLEEEAIAMGADAVIGIRPDTTSSGSQCYLGTAIKFINK